MGTAFFGVVGNMLRYAGGSQQKLMSDMMVLFGLAGAISLFAAAGALAMVRQLGRAESLELELAERT